MMLGRYPSFVGRQREITRLTKAVRPSDGRSHVVFLSGNGGIGKTWLLEKIEKQFIADRDLYCTRLMSMDDSSYHLPSYFCRMTIDALGPDAFAGYIEAINYFQDKERRKIDFRTINTHLRQTEDAFIQDYNRLANKKHIVMLIDSFEVVQDTNLWDFFIKLFRRLENTTFIISGREGKELKSKFIGSRVRVEMIELKGLPTAEIDAFFAGIVDINDERKRKLALLTASNPLLLCLALDCYRYGYWLDEIDQKSLKEIEELVYQNTYKALRFRYEFEKSLVVAYAGTEPFFYFIRQLAHASRRINKEIFKTLIPFRSEAEAEEWWQTLQTLPYIHRYAYGDYISVHDRLQNLIFNYVIPVRDPDYVERKQINQKLINCYEKILTDERRHLQQIQDEFERDAQQLGGFLEQRQPVGNLARLATLRNTLERKIWILQSEVLHYQLRVDLISGSRIFIQQFDEATIRRQLTLRQGLANQVKPLVEDGLIPVRTEEHFELSCRLVIQQSDDGQTDDALRRVKSLLEIYRESFQKIQLLELRAGCKLGLQHGVIHAAEDYKRALALAQKKKGAVVDRARLEKQLGWCCRQLGDWEQAGYWYSRAQERLVKTKATNRSTLAEMASIYTNAAYVEALRGKFPEAMDLGQRGLRYRMQLNLRREQALSLSTLGEVCRYNRSFTEALTYYRKAKEIFADFDDRGWLGRIWQQEAICIQQMGGDLYRALDKLKEAIDYCILYNTLALPSAYNRAGRIIAAFDDLQIPLEERLQQSLLYFRTGLARALENKDSWFFLANCVDAMDVVLREYERHQLSRLLKIIKDFDRTIEQEVGKELLQTRGKFRLYFPDLQGRRHIILGTLDYLAGLPEKNTELLDKALQHYLTGFTLITRGFFGSYGIIRMSEELDRLTERVIALPPKIASRWRGKFAKAWKMKNIHPTLTHFSDYVANLINIKDQSAEQELFKKVA